MLEVNVRTTRRRSCGGQEGGSRKGVRRVVDSGKNVGRIQFWGSWWICSGRFRYFIDW